MNWRGNAFSGCSVAGSFTTVTTTGAPTALTGTAGSVCLVAYRLIHGDATGFTCSTAGITLATNCSGRTGWNTWGVNTNSDPAFYSCGHDYELVLQGGTVGGTCVSGYLVAAFSLMNRAGLQPQSHGRKLAITVGGATAVNWAAVEGCTTAVTLSCTSVYTADHLVQRPVVDPCSTIYTADHLVQRPVVDACSTIFTVQKVLDVSNIGAGAAPSANSVACTVWDELRSQHGTCGTFGYLLDCTVSSAVQPEIPGRRLALTAGGNVGVNWARVENCTTVQGLTCTSIYVADHLVQRPVVDACSTIYTADHLVQRPIVDACSAIFSVRKLIDPPVIDSCSAIFSVVKVTDPVVIDPCSTVFSTRSVLNNVPGVTAGVTVATVNDKTGYSLSAAGIACVTSAPLTEPANVPGWPMSVCTALAWIAALASNCITQTAQTQSVCNRALNATIASAPITCTSTIVHRGTFGTVIP